MDQAKTSASDMTRQIHHNVYGIKSVVFHVLCAVSLALWVLSYAEIVLVDLPMVVSAAVIPACLLVAIGIALYISRPRTAADIKPYTRQPGFEFIGLHNLNGENIQNQHDVLPRDEEVSYINRLLEEIIFPQTIVKQALTLVGPSGCGKSTILSFFRQQYGQKYQIFDFSGNYHELYAQIANAFGSNLSQSLSEKTHESKVVIILDQFERFFHLSHDEQEKVQTIIQHFCRKDIAVVISMREEYLADFLKRFDMNNLSESWNVFSEENSKGILKELINVLQIHDLSSASCTPSGRFSGILSWNHHQYKNNLKTHLAAGTNSSEKTILERVGPTLLYCRNQKDVSFRIGQEKTVSSFLESKCRTLFGEKGSEWYQRHSEEPLIEQQIFFHMAEFNRKINNFSDEALDEFFSNKNNELLSQYFSVQLSCCPDVFLASRLLYLLSQARIHQISFTIKNIEEGLFPDLFSRKGRDMMRKCILKLEELQLIRRSIETSDREYEIAHDFIADSYLSFCSIIMDRDVKNALDLFIAELTDPKRASTMPEKFKHRSQYLSNPFFHVSTIITAILITVGWIVERFIWNPWDSVFQSINAYGRYTPFFPLLINLLSVLYLHYLYDKIMKYYRGSKQVSIRRIYLLMMILVVAAVWGYPHFLLVDGICLAIAALNAAFLLDHRYPDSCKRALKSYGFKSAMIGLVFAGAHVYFLFFNQVLPASLIIAEFIMFTILVGYASYAHLTQEFLFAHMADASSEQI